MTEARTTLEAGLHHRPRREPTHEEIARQAWALWRARVIWNLEGDALGDWYEAEAQLRRLYA